MIVFFLQDAFELVNLFNDQVSCYFSCNVFQVNQKKNLVMWLSVMIHSYNPRIWETKMRESKVQGKPRLYIKTVSQKKKICHVKPPLFAPEPVEFWVRGVKIRISLSYRKVGATSQPSSVYFAAKRIKVICQALVVGQWIIGREL